MPSIPRPDPAAGHTLGTPGFELSAILGALIDRSETPIHVGADAPAWLPMPDRYVWLQTGLGPSGEDFTLWLEDGS